MTKMLHIGESHNSGENISKSRLGVESAGSILFDHRQSDLSLSLVAEGERELLGPKW